MRLTDTPVPNPPPVALVGAGPGDPGLLTIRAVSYLSQADLVLFDRLVPPRLLDHSRPTAERVCVDTLTDCHPDRYPQIHQTMIEAARRGLRVVRLKGGDPFLFGRGGEEAQALLDAGLDCVVVPGVTAALGAAACAGIPLTHRDHASAVAFVTGHERPDKPGSSLDWSALARFPGTLVFYMGIARLSQLVRNLIAQGKDPDTPSAAVRWATTSDQHTLEARLSELPAAVEHGGITAPALVVVGPVVGLRNELAWFERRPLFGKRVLVTRPRGQAGDMMRRLEDLGASVSLFPGVDIREPADWVPVDRVLADLANYRWLVFTSANGVHAFLRRLRQTGGDLRALGPLQLAAIGPATAQALRDYYLEPDLVPERYDSEHLAAALKEKVRGQRVLLARADRGRALLREELEKVATVEQVAVYSQVDEPAPEAEVVSELCAGRIDYVTLTSSNIARSILGRLGEKGQELVRAGSVRLVTISRVTSDAVRAMGFPVAAEAREETTVGVVEALINLARTD